MLVPDRLLAAFHALIKSALPRIDYYALYRAKVVARPGAGLLDLLPEDPRIPSMGSVPLRHGLPGVSVTVLRDSTVLVGWEDGDPSKPFCALWQGGEANVTAITISAEQITLGAEAGAEPTLKGATYRAAEAAQNAQLQSTLASMAGACTGALAPLAAGFTALGAAVAAFEGQAASFPTTKVKVT